MPRKLNLCLSCAEKLKWAFDLKFIQGSEGKTTVCQECRKKRVCATYELTGKK